MPITANISKFQQSIREVRVVTKKAEAEVVTRAARNVGYRAAQFTPKSSAGKIRAGLRRGNLLARLAASQLKREKGTYTRAELTSRMQSIERRRTSNVAALRAGWAKGITDLGGSFRGARVRSGRSASRGFGKAATVANLVSTIRNSVVTESARGQLTGAGDIPLMEDALARAVNFVAEDMRQYAQRKLEQQMRSVTSR